MSHYDTSELFNYLLHTPEGGLRKMLVDQKPMTEVHFNLLMKIVKNCSESDFGSHFDKQDFPKVKMSPAEIKLKEQFWKDCMVTFNTRGLLGPAAKVA